LGGIERSVDGEAPGGERSGPGGGDRLVEHDFVVQVRQRTEATADAVLPFILPEEEEEEEEEEEKGEEEGDGKIGGGKKSGQR